MHRRRAGLPAIREPRLQVKPRAHSQISPGAQQAVRRAPRDDPPGRIPAAPTDVLRIWRRSLPRPWRGWPEGCANRTVPPDRAREVRLPPMRKAACGAVRIVESRVAGAAGWLARCEPGAAWA